MRHTESSHGICEIQTRDLIPDGNSAPHENQHAFGSASNLLELYVQRYFFCVGTWQGDAARFRKTCSVSKVWLQCNNWLYLYLWLSWNTYQVFATWGFENKQLVWNSCCYYYCGQRFEFSWKTVDACGGQNKCNGEQVNFIFEKYRHVPSVNLLFE